MVKTIPRKNDTPLYACEECGLTYPFLKRAEKCEEWCKEHKDGDAETLRSAEESDSK